ncbi:MAG: hypothetical protein JSS61_00760 [Verrucomicrobia bacterium]|nr:hypothetical protein [Verrucomicrobiota bacterium]
MRTFFSSLLGLLVIAVLAAAVIGYIFWARVPDILSNNLSKKLQVPVQIDDMNLSLSNIQIQKVEIGSPPGSLLRRAFACREIDIRAPLTRYLSKEIVIDEIDLQDVYLGLEFDSATGATGNWSRMMEHMAASMQTADTSGRSVLIHKLILTNIDTDIVYRKEGGKVKKLPRIDRIELTEISSQGGLPMDQIMNSVLGQMLRSVFEKQNIKNMLQNLLPKPQQLIPSNPLRGFFGQAEEDYLQGIYEQASND